jgi:hypothetical protein
MTSLLAGPLGTLALTPAACPEVEPWLAAMPMLPLFWPAADIALESIAATTDIAVNNVRVILISFSFKSVHCSG